MKIFILIIVFLVLAIACLYGYYGGFMKLSYQVSIVGGETIVFEKVKGDYRQSREVTDRIYYSLIDDFEIETYKGFGIYYDKPGSVKTEDLKSEVGCIIEEQDISNLDGVKGKFKVKELDKEKSFVIEFPFKGRLSSFLGVIKVYPYLDKVSKRQNSNSNSPVMEIWDIPNKKIIYRKAIN